MANKSFVESLTTRIPAYNFGLTPENEVQDQSDDTVLHERVEDVSSDKVSSSICDEQMYSPLEAGKIIGVSRRTMYTYIKNKMIRAEKVGLASPEWKIPALELEKLKQILSSRKRAQGQE